MYTRAVVLKRTVNNSRMFAVGDRVRVKGEKTIYTIAEVIETHGVAGYIAECVEYLHGKPIHRSGIWIPSGFARSAAETSSETRKRQKTHTSHKGGRRRRSQTRRA